MISLGPVIDATGKSFCQMEEELHLPSGFAGKIYMWELTGISWRWVQYVIERYGLTVETALEWRPDKGAKRKWPLWEKRMRGRWDRYRRQRIYEELTDVRQNYSLSFKMDVLRDYCHTDMSLREVAEKHGVPKEKVRGWLFKFSQV